MQAHSTLYGHARRLFGSLEAAVWASGINYDKERVQVLWTRTGILEWIRREWRKGRDIRPGVTKTLSAGVFNAAVREFGGWYPAIRAAKIRGFTEVRLRKWTPETLIASLKSYGPEVRLQDVAVKDPGLASTLRRTFGCWAKAREAAGYTPTLPSRPRRWTEQVIVQTIRERGRSQSRLRTRVFVDLGGFAKAAADMFGSWPKAVRAAGFTYVEAPTTGPYKWTREAILKTIQARAASGKSLWTVDVRNEGGALYDAALRAFGGWDNALQAARVERPDRTSKWPKERTLAELIRRKKLGLRIAGNLYQAIYHHFGGIKKALGGSVIPSIET